MADPLRRRAEAIFHEVVSLSLPERRAALDERRLDDELRAEVEALLEADASTAHLEPPRFEPVPGPAPSSTESSSLLAEGVGSRIGSYKLLQRIGEGGFGVVFMAEQSWPIVRRVALKIIKLGMDTKRVVARFEAERQALAMMDHPNIARVFDAGATDAGRPYFVMELVRGDPITEYCDHRKLAIQERLDLFCQVCDAVQHAHQKGIIHRDIKPSNVLVTVSGDRPIPKVIDFGIAKAMHTKLTEQTLFTEFRQLIGTPQYMSPEQADKSGIDIDTRSDIYSLGVLLYELLTGSTPLDREKLRSADYGEIQKLILDSEVRKPSTVLATLKTADEVAAHRQAEPRKLGTLLQGDLDWIVLKSLEKDRVRRYEAANGLREDVLRYLRNEPVTASPPSTTYRLRKFLRRNRVAVLAGSAAAAGLLLGLIGTSIGLVWALDERKRAVRAEETATRRAEEAEQIAAFMVAAFESPDPSVSGRTVTVLEVLDEATRRLERQEDMHPALRGRMAWVLGRTFASIGESERAANVLQQAAEALAAKLGETARDTQRARSDWAMALADSGRTDEALMVMDQVIMEDDGLHVAEENGTSWSPARARARVLMKAGRIADAIELHTEIAEELAARFGITDRRALEAQLEMATARAASGGWSGELKFLAALYDGARAHLGEDDLLRRRLQGTLGAALSESGDHSAANEHLGANHTWLETRYGVDHPQTLAALADLLENSLRWYRICRGDGFPPEFFDEMISRAEEGCRAAEDRLRNAHPTRLRLNTLLAEVYRATGRDRDALEIERKLAEGAGDHVRDPADISRTMALVRELNHTGKHEQALERMLTLMEDAEAFLEPTHFRWNEMRRQLAETYLLLEQPLPALAETKRRLEAAYKDYERSKSSRIQEVINEAIDVGQRAAEQRASDEANAMLAEMIGELRSRAEAKPWPWRMLFLRAVQSAGEAHGRAGRPRQAMQTAYEILDYELGRRKAGENEQEYVSDASVHDVVEVVVRIARSCGDKIGSEHVESLLNRVIEGAEVDEEEWVSEWWWPIRRARKELLALLARANRIEEAWAVASRMFEAELERTARTGRADVDGAAHDLIWLAEYDPATDPFLTEPMPSNLDKPIAVGVAQEVVNWLVPEARESRPALPAALNIPVADIVALHQKMLDAALADDGTTRMDGWLQALRRGTEVFARHLDARGAPEAARDLRRGGHRTQLAMRNQAASQELLAVIKALQSYVPDQAPATPARGLSFDGGRAYVIVPDLFFDGVPPWTLEVIVTPRRINHTMPGLVSTANRGGLSLLANEGFWAFELHNNGSYQRPQEDRPIELGRQYHIAGVWDGQNLRLYVNGQLADTRTEVDNPTDLTCIPFFIGADADHAGPQYNFDGVFEQVRISRAVAYEDEFGTPDDLENIQGAVGLYDFRLNTGRFITDRSGSGNHAINMGAEWLPAAKGEGVAGD